MARGARRCAERLLFSSAPRRVARERERGRRRIEREGERETFRRGASVRPLDETNRTAERRLGGDAARRAVHGIIGTNTITSDRFSAPIQSISSRALPHLLSLPPLAAPSSSHRPRRRIFEERVDRLADPSARSWSAADARSSDAQHCRTRSVRRTFAPLRAFVDGRSVRPDPSSDNSPSPPPPPAARGPADDDGGVRGDDFRAAPNASSRRSLPAQPSPPRAPSRVGRRAGPPLAPPRLPPSLRRRAPRH